jgi:hypothetical protein
MRLAIALVVCFLCSCANDHSGNSAGAGLIGIIMAFAGLGILSAKPNSIWKLSQTLRRGAIILLVVGILMVIG